MPLTREQLQFGLILLCVPLQYFATQYFSSTEVSRSYEIAKLVRKLNGLYPKKWEAAINSIRCLFHNMKPSMVTLISLKWASTKILRTWPWS